MAIFDKNSPPSAPDSSLDSDVASAENFTLMDSTVSPIAPGDWVDVHPSCGIVDPNWGYSFQVMDVHPNENVNLASIDILITEDEGATYFGTGLTAGAWVQNNYRRVPRAVS